MSSPLITIAIPTYGREKVLIDTVTQALAQDVKNHEVVVVDQTVEHKTETATFFEQNTDPRLRYFRVGPPSLPAARNFAADIARADTILFLDDDVIIKPNFARTHLEAFEKDPKIVAVGGRVIDRINTQKLTKTPLQFDKYGLGRNTFNCDVSQFAQSFPGGNMSIRKSALKAIGGFDTSYQQSAVREESDTAYRLISKGGKIYFEAEAVIDHLKAPVGGARIHVHYFDNIQFYATDTLFALKSVRLRYLPRALAVRYVHAVRNTNFATKIRRSGLFIGGLVLAIRYRLVPARIVARELSK